MIESLKTLPGYCSLTREVLQSSGFRPVGPDGLWLNRIVLLPAPVYGWRVRILGHDESDGQPGVGNLTTVGGLLRVLRQYPEKVVVGPPKPPGCQLDTDGDGNCPKHPQGCPPEPKTCSQCGTAFTRENDETPGGICAVCAMRNEAAALADQPPTTELETKLTAALRKIEELDQWQTWREGELAKALGMGGGPSFQLMLDRVRAAVKFKGWVHGYLDDKGVPSDPDPEGTARHGCRISGRMKWVFDQIQQDDARPPDVSEEDYLRIGKMIQQIAKEPLEKLGIDPGSGFAVCLQRIKDLTEALQTIAKARRLVNGMVIDPCPAVMCYASKTADVAKDTLKKLGIEP